MRIFTILLLTTVSAAATDCKVEPPSRPPEPWAWRTIDGKRCWYAGARGRSKALLRWPKVVPAADVKAAEPAPEPEIVQPVQPGYDYFRDRWQPIEDLERWLRSRRRD
jgi:hypothetical protein